MNKLLKKFEKHALDEEDIIKMAKRKDIEYVYYNDLADKFRYVFRKTQNESIIIYRKKPKYRTLNFNR